MCKTADAMRTNFDRKMATTSMLPMKFQQPIIRVCICHLQLFWYDNFKTITVFCKYDTFSVKKCRLWHILYTLNGKYLLLYVCQPQRQIISIIFGHSLLCLASINLLLLWARQNIRHNSSFFVWAYFLIEHKMDVKCKYLTKIWIPVNGTNRLENFQTKLVCSSTVRGDWYFLVFRFVPNHKRFFSY